MKKQIKLYRVVLNVLFYVFYVLLVSILFSFIFPTVLVLLGKNVLDPTNPDYRQVFINIQILIVVIVLIFSLILRKYFYLPITVDEVTEEKKIDLKVVENKQDEKNNNENIEKEEKIYESIIVDNIPELDIKIGKEIK